MVDIVLAIPLFCFAKLFELDHVKLTFFNFPMKSSSLVVLSGYEVAIILGSEFFFTQKFLNITSEKTGKHFPVCLEYALCLIDIEIIQNGNLLGQMFCICTFCGQFTAATLSEGFIIKLLL